MSDTSRAWFVMGWLADVYYDAFAHLLHGYRAAAASSAGDGANSATSAG